MADPPAYEREPYLRELKTEVIASGELDGRPWAVLADTLFYAEGGGQPADHGRLNGVDVTDVRRGDQDVLHFLSAPVPAGPAALELDWNRRYDPMQQHTAQHLLSALAAGRYGWVTTSFHLGSRQCDVELDTPAIETGALHELEEFAMAAVRDARAVTARRVSAEAYARLDIRSRGLPESHSGDVRLVEIEGLDVTTCGGTHLRSTAEIEALQLGATESVRGGTRLYWRAGRRVRRRLAELEARNRELRALFETSGEELVDAAAARLAAAKESRTALRRATEELADARADALALEPGTSIVAHLEGADAGRLRRVAQRLVDRAPAKAALLTGSGDGGPPFLLAVGPESEVDAAAVGARVAEILGGRGGGSGAIFQGKARSLERLDDARRCLRKQKTGGRSPRSEDELL